MGRHSRRGPVDTGNTTDTSDIPLAQGAARPPGPGTGRRRKVPAPSSTGASAPDGAPHVRGGHPEQREPGGGWGDVASSGSGPRMGAGYTVPGPRREYVTAFPERDGDQDGATPDAPSAATSSPAAAPSPSVPPPPRDPYASVTDWDEDPDAPLGADGAEGGDGAGSDTEAKGAGGAKGGRGRTFTGIAAAAVTTVLAVVVAGQVTGGAKDSTAESRSVPGGGVRDTDDPASRSDDRATPSNKPKVLPATYEQKMGKKYPMDAKLKASGDFEAISGFDKAPGKGRLWKYRVDVEKGLGLDGELFAKAVQKTLNDNRSWAHAKARTFERISSGKPDFVITLASPGTTADWCAKSGLDTTQDNVSCDSAATERVMINAYRWAQGAKTYGDAVQKEFGSAIFPYRQMLINHEVGHRLGYNHTDCDKDGDLAPVMQQQTKFLDHDGITCKANPWVFPKG
ncbi:DUF3152 domain-containing protein [Streptomyces formicae]